MIWSARLSVGLERGFDQAILRVLPRSNLIRTLHCGDDLWTAAAPGPRPRRLQRLPGLVLNTDPDISNSVTLRSGQHGARQSAMR